MHLLMWFSADHCSLPGGKSPLTNHLREVYTGTLNSSLCPSGGGGGCPGGGCCPGWGTAGGGPGSDRDVDTEHQSLHLWLWIWWVTDTCPCSRPTCAADLTISTATSGSPTELHARWEHTLQGVYLSSIIMGSTADLLGSLWKESSSWCDESQGWRLLAVLTCTQSHLGSLSAMILTFFQPCF